VNQPARPTSTPAAAPSSPGEQTGKRSSQERNDPAVQPGAREGQPDSRRLREERRTGTDRAPAGRGRPPPE
jgi:hypothetical protein